MPIFNVFTRKFSEFVPQNVDDVVGLTGGANSIGQNGGGGGATITYTFTQAAPVVPALYLGAAVRVDVASGLWECTLATTALDAEFYAFIVAISGDNYTVQFAGVVPPGTPLLTGLLNGTPYYLSDTVPGGISAVPPAIAGEVNLPVLWAMDNGNSVIKMSRGFIEGSGGGGGGGGGSTPNNVATVTQGGNTFALGDVLYLQADQTFALAHSRTLAASQAEWVVTSIVTPGLVFTIQQGGRIQGLILTDDVGAAIASGPIYYVSPIVGQEGKLTQVNPISSGFYSKPFYVQQVLASNTGWLLDQRPVVGPVANPAASPWVYMGDLNDANNFSDPNILVGPNGERYGAYKLIVNRVGGVGSIIRATGPNPISIGFRFAIAGVFNSTPGTYASYINGVNSTAGINTTTFWGNISNSGFGVGRDNAMILPPTSTTVDLRGGEGLLDVSPGAASMTGSWITVDVDTTPGIDIGYTNIGWCGMGSGVTIPTGVQLFFGGAGTAIVPGSLAVISVFGIPNT